MATLLHRTTKQYLVSVDPNGLPEPIANYIDEPDLSAVTGQPSKYWIITGDIVTEMSVAEKAIVDQTILDVSRDQTITEVDDLESTLRQIVLMVIGEINTLRQQLNTTTAEVNQLTTTTFADRTIAQVKNQLRNGYGS